ncbi:MAG: uracil-DNA glycosylase [Acidobacteria bacterium]|nr:uracil-DNA glycosylase [Acidobacteriota bacterium]
MIRHLTLLEEFGVQGFSQSATWRRRPGEAAPAGVLEGSAAGEGGRDQPGGLPATERAAARSRPPVEAPLPDLPDPAALDVDPQQWLDELRTHIGDCTRCKLHGLGRRQVVFGVGNPRARLMFVGEGPGYDEDVQGIPFVGRAGQLLTKIIEAMNLTRDQVYIANVVKCRPPGNRNPEPDEVATCEPFLFRQIDVIRPAVIVALGTYAAQVLLRTREPISRLRGQVFEYRGARLVPTFHPAFLLRSPERKRETWEDMKKVMVLLATSG